MLAVPATRYFSPKSMERQDFGLTDFGLTDFRPTDFGQQEHEAVFRSNRVGRLASRGLQPPTMLVRCTCS